MLNTISMSPCSSELNLANRLVGNTISGRVQLARYIRAPIALRYGTSGPRTSFHYLRESEMDHFPHLMI